MMSTPGRRLRYRSYIAFRPASSPPLVHHENISSLPLAAAPAAAGAVVAPAAGFGAVVGAAAGAVVGAAAGLGAVVGAAAGVAAPPPQAANKEPMAAAPAVPANTLSKPRRSMRRTEID